MQLSFHGAARQVTGSKHLLQLQSGTKVLLDCGMFQGNPQEANELNRNWGFVPAEVNYVILSHAHIDHCGLIPKLVADGYRGKIYCTPVTFEMVQILLMDSAKIQEADIRYHNKKRAHRGEEPVESLYSIEDAQNCFERFELVSYHEPTKLTDEVSFEFTDVGHILGSAAVHLTLNEGGKQTRLTFSGDVGRYNDDLLNSPETFSQADYLIMESTYGNKLHAGTGVTGNKLLEIIADTCLNKRGKLIIPSFSVGRTQEIVYVLNMLEIEKKLPQVKFYVDSPLSVKATDVMRKHMNLLNDNFQQYRLKDKDPFDFKNLHYITEAEDSKALNEVNEPYVVISASGMADAGRVKHHIKHNIEDSRSTILMVGYCEPNSLGGKLLRGQREVTIFGERYQVNASIKKLNSLSAHGDYDDMCRFIQCQEPAKVKKLFLVHGEYDVQQTFSEKLHMRGYNNVVIPSLHESFDLQ